MVSSSSSSFSSSLLPPQQWLSFSTVFVASFLLLLTLTMSEVVDGATGDAGTSDQVYAVHYSQNADNTCGVGNAIGLTGYLVGKTQPLRMFAGPAGEDKDNSSSNDTVADLLSCGQQFVCQVNSSSPECLGNTDVTNGPFEVTKMGEVVYEPTGVVYGPNNCTVGGWTPKCNFDYVTLDDLKEDPRKYFENKNQREIDNQLSLFHYAAVYNDQNCTNLVGINTWLSGEPSTIPITLNEENNDVVDSVTCEEAFACLLDPTSKACKETGLAVSESTLNHTVEKHSDGLWYVHVNDPTNANVGQEVREYQDEIKCVESSTMPHCYLTMFAAGYLAVYPDAINGDFVAPPPQEDSTLPTSEPTATSQESSSSLPPSSETTMSPQTTLPTTAATQPNEGTSAGSIFSYLPSLALLAATTSFVTLMVSLI